MRARIIPVIAAIGFSFAGQQAYAVGCITGGIAGAAAGHLVHHGVLGAIGGCVAGHHYHKQQEEEHLRNQQYGNDQYPNGYNRSQ